GLSPHFITCPPSPQIMGLRFARARRIAPTTARKWSPARIRGIQSRTSRTEAPERATRAKSFTDTLLERDASGYVLTRSSVRGRVRYALIGNQASSSRRSHGYSECQTTCTRSVSACYGLSSTLNASGTMPDGTCNIAVLVESSTIADSL